MPSAFTRKREEQRKRARERQIKNIARFGTFGAIIVVVIVAVAFFLSPVFTPKESGITQGTNGLVVNIQAAMDGFDIKEIHAKVGETVTVNLQSLDNEHHTDGGGKHQFAIDELGVNIIAQPLSASRQKFTPTKPGVYTYYCDICCGGKANPTMNGKLIVED